MKEWITAEMIAAVGTFLTGLAALIAVLITLRRRTKRGADNAKSARATTQDDMGDRIGL